MFLYAPVSSKHMLRTDYNKYPKLIPEQTVPYAYVDTKYKQNQFCGGTLGFFMIIIII